MCNRHDFSLSADLIDVQQMWKNKAIFLSAPLMHIQPMLQKAPMNDLDNPFLLLFRHLVITR